LIYKVTQTLKLKKENEISDKGIKEICEIIKNNKEIENIYLGRNKLKNKQ
jgi:hypothetical protein